MPGFYPMMMNLNDRSAVVIGGGEVAARKVEMLVKCGAVVKVVAPDLHQLLEPLVSAGKVVHIEGEYEKGQLKGAALVIASTDDTEVNRAVYDDATQIGIPVNVVDVPELCSFIVPSIVESGDLIVAISTSGKSPAMAKRIRKELQALFGEEYALMLKLMGEARRIMMKKEPDINRRMVLLSELANSDLFDRIKSGERPSAAEIVEGALSK